MIHPFITQSIH